MDKNKGCPVSSDSVLHLTTERGDQSTSQETCGLSTPDNVVTPTASVHDLSTPDNVVTPSANVDDLFKKMGSKLGWFQYSDLNTAMKTVSALPTYLYHL